MTLIQKIAIVKSKLRRYDFESGYSHPAEPDIQELFDFHENDPEFLNMFEEDRGLATFIECLRHLDLSPASKTYWVKRGLSSPDLQVRWATVDSMEDWEETKDLLRNHKESCKGLCETIANIISLWDK
jgi:hypothetical protein